MRRLGLILGGLAVGLAVYMGILLLNSWPAAVSATVTTLDAAPVVAAPIFSEEVPLSEAHKLNAVVVKEQELPNPHLSLLEDTGAAVVTSHATRRETVSFSVSSMNMSPADSLMSRLRTTESSFVGVGLEGAAKVNGEVFSWANVNLSNISYG